MINLQKEINIQKEVEEYINSHPFVRINLFENLVNYSKLSRKIIKEKNLSENNIDAIIVACRRIYQKYKKKNKFDSMTEQMSIEVLLKQTSLQIKNKISVVILSLSTQEDKLEKLRKHLENESKNNKQKETFHIIKGASATTVITTKEVAKRMNKAFSRNIIKRTDDLVEVILKSPAQLEDVPGVVAHLYSLLGENNINIVETMSCWTDTILVLKEKDLPKAIELLNF